MSSKIKQTMASLVILSFSLSDAALALSKDLLFKGKPIEPIVIDRMANGDSSRFDPVDLRKYTLKSQKIHIEKRMGSPEKDEFGYSYRDKGSNQRSSPYTTYRVIADLGNHRHLILNNSSGGGSGHFSSLFVVEREGHFVKNVGEISGGDRANGDIQNITYKIKDGTGILHGDVSLTPRSVFLVALESLNPSHPLLKDDKLTDNLIDGAQCYGGYLELEGPWDKPLKPISITIKKDDCCRIQNPVPALQVAYDATLDKLLDEKESLTLDQAGMNNFAEKVIEKYESLKKENLSSTSK